ncbi:MAG: hypothetical protein IJ429_05560 [Lachnospiraceae bacterium]|nr:hypothetical protein [Lachnospiraceae bacterium]
MFGFGKSKAAKELDEILKSLQLAFENNYKDNARANLKKFESAFDEAKATGKLRPKEAEVYGATLAELKERLKNFKH